MFKRYLFAAFFGVALTFLLTYYVFFLTDMDRISQYDESARIRELLRQEKHYQFAGCQLRKPSTYHSQDGEDKALYEHFFSNPQLCNGTFLEIGAIDGVQFSNTLMYERDLNWTGVLVEGSPSSFTKLKTNRPTTPIFNCAVCPEGSDSVKFIDAEIHPAMRGAVHVIDQYFEKRKVEEEKTIEVPCCSLGELVQQSGFRHLDFAVIDVEGSEMYALRSYDWSIPIHVLVIEVQLHRQEIESFVNSKGYYSPTDWNVCQRNDNCHSSRAYVNKYWPKL